MATTLSDSVVENLRELHRVRQEQDAIVSKINKIHSKLRRTTSETAETFKGALWERLMSFYVKAKTLAEREQKLCALCLSGMGESSVGTANGSGGSHSSAARKRSAEIAENRKKKLKTDGGGSSSTPSAAAAAPASGAPPSTTAVAPTAAGPSSSPASQGSSGGSSSGSAAAAVGNSQEHSGAALAGEQVAARVSGDDAAKDDWIVVKVVKFDKELRKYEVVDDEPGDEDDPRPRVYHLPASCIIPLPRPNDMSSGHDFTPSSHVLAVYPGTTALYRATVVGQTRKRKTDPYYLEFDDDEEEGIDGMPQRCVPFHHVVPLPQNHRQ